MSVSFCLPNPVAVSAFMICGVLCAYTEMLCAYTEMLWMCVLYVSFGSKVRPRTFGCIVVYVRPRLLIYSAGSGVNRVHVVFGNNKILRTPPLHISSTEGILPRLTLAQLRTNKSFFLKSYLHKVGAKSHPSLLCPLCNTPSLQLHTHHPWICVQTPLE